MRGGGGGKGGGPRGKIGSPYVERLYLSSSRGSLTPGCSPRCSKERRCRSRRALSSAAGCKSSRVGVWPGGLHCADTFKAHDTGIQVNKTASEEWLHYARQLHIQ